MTLDAKIGEGLIPKTLFFLIGSNDPQNVPHPLSNMFYCIERNIILCACGCAVEQKWRVYRSVPTIVNGKFWRFEKLCGEFSDDQLFLSFKSEFCETRLIMSIEICSEKSEPP